jgi:hypothetical protein
MYCTSCGGELDARGLCLRCGSQAPLRPPVTPTGDAFAAARVEAVPSTLKTVAFVILSLLLFAVVLLLNYVRALRWAGVINAESSGYMMGGVLVAVGLGFLGMFVVRKLRGRKLHPASKTLGVAAIAFVISCMAFLGEAASRRPLTEEEVNHRIGDLLKEAAGTKPPSADADWWDGAARDFFHDLIEMNKQYAAEVKGLDNSAIEDLYSVNSYSSKARMEAVVTQLQAAQAVDDKYASLDPIIKKMEERIAKAKVSESEKQEFLKGMEASMTKALAPRNEAIRTGREWMKSTIDLYQFAIGHSPEYSIRGNKLYFENDDASKEFTARQTQAIALHKEFLKTKGAAEDSRKQGLGKLGVSPTDMAPPANAPPQPQ